MFSQSYTLNLFSYILFIPWNTSLHVLSKSVVEGIQFLIAGLRLSWWSIQVIVYNRHPKSKLLCCVYTVLTWSYRKTNDLVCSWNKSVLIIVQFNFWNQWVSLTGLNYQVIHCFTVKRVLLARFKFFAIISGNKRVANSTIWHNFVHNLPNYL